MATGGFLPGTSADPVFLGDYSPLTPYPNPISEGSFSGFTPNALKFFEEKDPSSHSPGDIDELIYYPYKEGAFRDTATAKVPFQVVLDSYRAQQAIIDDYLKQLDAYNSRAMEYNAAYLSNSNGKTTRTETKTYDNGSTRYSYSTTYTKDNPLPDRPEKPATPLEYNGIRINPASTKRFADFSQTDKLEKIAVPYANGDHYADSLASLRSGFLQASTTDSANAPATSWNNVGHIFGRLGQGSETTPSKNVKPLAYQWEQ